MFILPCYSYYYYYYFRLCYLFNNAGNYTYYFYNIAINTFTYFMFLVSFMIKINFFIQIIFKLKGTLMQI